MLDNSTDLALQTVLSALEDVKAINIEKIDLTDISPSFDIAVIASGSSSAHVRGITEKLTKGIKQKPLGVEGKGDYLWVLVDYGTIIVHILQDEIRAEYNFEQLYSEWLKFGKTTNPPQTLK